MAYYFSKVVGADFDEAVRRTVEALKEEGFGVLTDIDVKDTLKKKINADFRRYRILGACNPQLAHEALQRKTRSAPCCRAMSSSRRGLTARSRSPRSIPWPR